MKILITILMVLTFSASVYSSENLNLKQPKGPFAKQTLHLTADPASPSLATLQSFYETLYDCYVYDLHFKIKPYNAYLQSFSVKFNKFLHQEEQHGLVSNDGDFLTFYSEIITDPTTINTIVTTYQSVGAFDPDLNAYLSSSNQVYLVDALNTPPQFAIVGGQTISFNSPYFSTFGVYVTFTQVDVSNGQGLVFSSPYQGNFKKEIVKSLGSFPWGNPKAPKEIWFLSEPNCPYCHLAYQGLKDAVNKGELFVHIIPVAFIDNTSRGKVWALFDAKYPHYKGNKRPQDAFIYNEEFYDLQLLNVEVESGGLLPISNPSKSAARKLSKNENLIFNKYGLFGVPTFYYYNTAGIPTITIINENLQSPNPEIYQILLSQIKEKSHSSR